MRRRRLLTAVAGVVLIAGCNNGEPDNGTPSDETPDERVEIQSHELQRTEEGTADERVAIAGEVRINKADLDYVELEARFFDANEEQLDVTNERLEELEVGSQPFEIEFPNFGEQARAVEGYQIEVATIVEL